MNGDFFSDLKIIERQLKQRKKNEALVRVPMATESEKLSACVLLSL